MPRLGRRNIASMKPCRIALAGKPDFAHSSSPRGARSGCETSLISLRRRLTRKIGNLSSGCISTAFYRTPTRWTRRFSATTRAAGHHSCRRPAMSCRPNFTPKRLPRHLRLDKVPPCVGGPARRRLDAAIGADRRGASFLRLRPPVAPCHGTASLDMGPTRTTARPQARIHTSPVGKGLLFASRSCLASGRSMD